VWSGSFALGGVAAPLVGGVLLEHFWWGSVFVLAVPVVVLLLAVGPALLPESRDGATGGFDTAGALLSLSAVLLFVYGVKRLAASGADVVPAAAVVSAVLLGVVFVRRQRRIPHPLLDLSMFRSPRVAVALGSNALSFFVFYGIQLAIAQYLQLVLGLSPLRAGLWLLPSVLAYLAASFLGPALARRFPPGRLVAAGLAAMAAGFAVLATGTVPAFVAGTVIYSVGLAPVYILTTDMVVAAVRPARAGMAAAVTETGCELGGALGIALLGSLTVAVFRHGMAGAVPPGSTLTDALAAAAALPPAQADALHDLAVSAFAESFAVMCVAAAVLVTAAAALALIVLRPDRAPRPSPSMRELVAPQRAPDSRLALPDSRLAQSDLCLAQPDARSA
jgi:DHA2 family multidrug resistance protein-like MFS transporter